MTNSHRCQGIYEDEMARGAGPLTQPRDSVRSSGSRLEQKLLRSLAARIEQRRQHEK